MADPDADDPRAQLLDLLLEKVEDDAYPSSTMLDFIEQLLQPDDVPAYAAVLMRKVGSEVYPSVSIMRRLVEVTQ
jgi:hypothetical protein